MAPQAPRPGSTPNSPAVIAREKRRRMVAVVKLAGEEYRLHLADLGPEDQRISRKQTGFPIARFFDDFDYDSVLAIVWLARRKAGETSLVYRQLEQQYPTNESIDEAGWSFDVIEEGAIDADVVGDDAIDAEVVDDDPLPSAEP